jgi:hypothetical protein
MHWEALYRRGFVIAIAGRRTAVEGKKLEDWGVVTKQAREKDRQ